MEKKSLLGQKSFFGQNSFFGGRGKFWERKISFFLKKRKTLFWKNKYNKKMENINFGEKKIGKKVGIKRK